MKKLLLGVLLLASPFAAKGMIEAAKLAEKSAFIKKTNDSAKNISKEAKRLGLTDIKNAADALVKLTNQGK